jgi:hypothetical protein
MGYYVSGHGAMGLELYPPEEFASRFPEQTRGYQAVRLVDSEKIVLHPDDPGWPWVDMSEAFLSDYYAIAAGGRLFTEFIYAAEDVDQRLTRAESIRPVTGYAAVRTGGYWTFLNAGIPGRFENIVGIDERTAFVKINGLYGILDYAESVR